MEKPKDKRIDTPELINEIAIELDKMIKVPASDLSMRAQQCELACSKEFIVTCLSRICDNEIYLLDRLKHSESERFYGKD